VRVEQSKLSGTIFTKVMGGLADYFDTWQIGGRKMMEAHIKEMIAWAGQQNVEDLVKRVKEKVDSLKTGFQQYTTDYSRPIRQDAVDATFMLPTNTCGEISRLPSTGMPLQLRRAST
jgi:hypothetical protein